MIGYKKFNEEFNKQMQCYFGEDTIFKFEKSVTGVLSNCAIHYKRKKAI